MINKNLEIFFFLVLILSSPFWWQRIEQRLEDFLFWNEMAANPELLTSQITSEQKLEELKPIRNKQVDDLEIEAEGAISVFFNQRGDEKILFEKNGDIPLPIASLTKLMTANIVLTYFDNNQEETAELLFPLLIGSDNEAAVESAKIIGEEAFIELMNTEAKRLKMNQTYFANPTGLDPIETGDSFNYSTAKDLIKLAKYITFERPLIWEISTIQKFNDITNTNELLGKIAEIVGGKTGQTPLAGKCLLLIIKAPKDKGFITNVILNSKNHFEEMKKLIDWIEYAYKW